MAVSIDQRPLYTTLPIGQQIIFAVSENTIVAKKFKVKFIAEVHVSNKAINISSGNSVIGTFKTTPNNAGVGIFDLRPILETFVKSDNEASEGDTSYKLDKDIDFPMHLIDRFAMSENAIRNFAIQFKVEWSETANGEMVSGQAANSDEYLFFNGVLQYDDVLTLGKINTSGHLVKGNNYGYNLKTFQVEFPGDQKSFLTNAPTNQYARITDYGTLAFFNLYKNQNVYKVLYKFYKEDNTLIGSYSVGNASTTGGVTKPTGNTSERLLYVAMSPGNLRGHNSVVDGYFASGEVAYYKLSLQDSSSVNLSQIITIYTICPNERGYEGIRLGWLNQWGTWDYYTFNMKSTRSITTKRIPYTQSGGTWNESTFKISGWKGGKKNFRVNSTEKIKINTDFVTEAEGVWFEELINSSEVYIVNGYEVLDVKDTITNKYIEPVVLTTSSYVKKTIANDKLMQYTFEIEKSKMKRTQAV